MANKNKLTLDAVKANMIELLKTFNNEGVELNDETIHDAVLDVDDGFTSTQSSQRLYSGGLQWIIWRNGGRKVKFPADWMQQSVAQLAEFIMSKQTQQ